MTYVEDRSVFYEDDDDHMPFPDVLRHNVHDILSLIQHL